MFLDISDLSHFKKKTKSIYLLKTQKLVKEDSKIHRLRQAKIPLTLFFLLLKNYKVSTDWSHQSPISNFPFKWSLWKLQGQIWDRKERVLHEFKSQENFALIWKEEILNRKLYFLCSVFKPEYLFCLRRQDTFFEFGRTRGKLANKNCYWSFCK